MICDNCNYRESCSYRGGNIYLSYRDECYIQHIRECLNEWNNIRLKYLNALSRIMKAEREDVNVVVKTSLLLHDAGKLAKIYQRKVMSEMFNFDEGETMSKNMLKGFKHEVLGSIYTFKVLRDLKLDKEIPYIAGWAVLLHHEAMRRKIKPEHLLTSIDDDAVDQNAILLLRSLLKDNLHLNLNANTLNTDKNEIGKIIDWLFKYIYQNQAKHILRMKISSLQHIVCFCDVRAANRIRRGEVTSPYFREVMRVFTDL
jgi:CRISPR-associated endonuclease Cas3-HD